VVGFTTGSRGKVAGNIFYKIIIIIKVKVKLSRYMPWRHMGGEQV
jgi:hypothetical protein